MVVVVAVKPAFFLVAEPFLFSDMLHQPVRPRVKAVCQFCERDAHGPSADIVQAAPRVAFQNRLFLPNILICAGAVGHKFLDFFQQLRRFLSFCQKPHQRRQIAQVPRIRTAKRHAFPVFRRHVQRVVPVRAAQAENVVCANLIKRGKMLNKQML